MINVTKTYLPPFDEYAAILKRAWDKSWITNNGELVQELEQRISQYIGVKNFLFTANGTVVLQMALKALNITKEVITTPFSYVATTNAILWEGCKPVFADINAESYCVDPYSIERLITEETQAILVTHVYGYPCDVEKIAAIADKYQLKVIYDGAHAFGCTYRGKSLLNFGDISTCSFHATKVFHTVEGGGVICQDEELARKLLLYRQFGHIGNNYFEMGINGKNSEFHAAMGLAILPVFDNIVRRRKEISGIYDSTLNFHALSKPVMPENFIYNYGYYPILFSNEETVLKVMCALQSCDILARRYFYPSLNRLPFLESVQDCPISESVSSRVLTLPLSHELNEADVIRIAATINLLLNQ